ncbi:clotting factor G beta subunit-like [Cydia amplana]|uniref:clotting factor G beta subunit-like n=1 Tax=Cydia amplana TaxID=1869771 RepID=UPI002FE578B3
MGKPVHHKQKACLCSQAERSYKNEGKAQSKERKKNKEQRMRTARHVNHSPLRVYKGETDSGNEFPFVVQFHKKKSPYFRKCTGSLIAETLVLTAAHCLTDHKIRELVVRYGDFTVPCNETQLYSEIIKAFVPKSLLVLGTRIDIGIALVKKIPNPRAKLSALDYIKTLYGLPAKYAGFGRILDLHVEPDNIARYNLTSVPLQAPRRGDSGDPLVYNGRIVGVIMGYRATGPRVTYEFSLVSSYLEWIQ